MKVTAVAAERTIKIEMKEREAEILRAVCAHIGGSPEGPCGVMDRLKQCLRWENVAVATDVRFSTTANGLYIEAAGE